MYRLLATDIDDTILCADGSLPEANRAALAHLHARGIPVVFSSGRADVSTRAVAQRILTPLDGDHIIAFNGARVVRSVDGRVIREHVLSDTAVAQVDEYARKHRLVLQAYIGDAFIADRDTPESQAYSRSTAMTFRVVPSLPAAAHVGTPKLLLIGDPTDLANHRRALAQLAGELAHDDTGVAFELTVSKPNYLEVLPAGVSKGSALVELCETLGIPILQTVAAGDSLNDISMLKAAGLGVAVANAREEVKAAADVVLDRTVDDGAIGELVERFFPG